MEISYQDMGKSLGSIWRTERNIQRIGWILREILRRGWRNIQRKFCNKIWIRGWGESWRVYWGESWRRGLINIRKVSKRRGQIKSQKIG